MSEQEKLYKPETVAEMLDMSPHTVRAWLREGTIKGIKVAGKVWRIKQSELDRLLQEGGQGE